MWAIRRFGVWRLLLIGLAVWGAWPVAGWWTGPLSSSVIRASEDENLECLGFSRDGSFFATLHDHHTCQVTLYRWSLPDLQRTVFWSAPLADTDESYCGFRLFAGGTWATVSDRSDPKPGLYDPSRRFALNLETGKEIAIPTLGEEFISYDGRLLFVAEEEGTITVIELQGGKIVGKLKGLRVLATTRDGNWAVSELPQGKMQLWDLREGQVRETSVVVSTPGKSAGPVGGNVSEDVGRWPPLFTADSKAFLDVGYRSIDVWDLGSLTKSTWPLPKVVATVSDDAKVAFERLGKVWDIQKGTYVVRPVRALDDFLGGILLDGQDWFFETTSRLPKSLHKWNGSHYYIGDYEFYIGPRQDSHGVLYRLHRASDGTKLTLPEWMLPPVSENGDPWRVDLHPERFAISSGYPDVIRIIELPPRRPWRMQIGLWVSLAAALVCVGLFLPKRRAKSGS